MNDAATPRDQVRTLRYLKWLVTLLTVTMIGGFLTIVALFVMRFSTLAQPALPASVALPDGAKATAFTQAGDWFAIVTDDNRILIYDRATGTLRQQIRIDIK